MKTMEAVLVDNSTLWPSFSDSYLQDQAIR